MSAKPTFYIRIDTLWQNSPDYFVGPFNSRNEAQVAIDAAVNHEDSNVVLPDQMARDLCEAVRVHGILSKTEACRAGMVSFGFGDEWNNLVGDEVPFTGWKLTQMKNEVLEYMY